MATTYSTQITNDRATPQVVNGGYGTGIFPIQWDYTVAGLALVDTDVVQLCKIPAGCKLLMPLSWIHFSATLGASTTIDMGYTAYKDKNNATVAADPNGLVVAQIATTTVPTLLNLYGTGVVGGVADFTDAVEDIIITVTCNDAGGTFDADIGDIWRGTFMVVLGGN